MTTRSFIGKGGETWEWEETPEVIEAVKQLHIITSNSKLNKPHPYKNEKTPINA